MPDFSSEDERFMREALRLAKKGRGATSPNPMVGAVLVRSGSIIGSGWHQRAGEPHETPYKLAGPLCDGGDVYFDHEGGNRLPDHRLLPAEVKPGEILAMLNCRAYSLAQASQYNGRFLPPVVLIKTDGTPELIRRRDTFEDLIGSDL